MENNIFIFEDVIIGFSKTYLLDRASRYDLIDLFEYLVPTY